MHIIVNRNGSGSELTLFKLETLVMSGWRGFAWSSNLFGHRNRSFLCTSFYSDLLFCISLMFLHLVATYWFTLVCMVLWHSLQSLTSVHCLRGARSFIFHVFSQTVSASRGHLAIWLFPRLTCMFWARLKKNERSHWMFVLRCMC